MRILTRARSLAAILVALFAIGLSASPASAHTGFESSDPADGEVLDEPVNEIALTFSGEATPAGEGFVVLDPGGTIRQPDEVTTDDNLTFVLRFDEPLVGGDLGVRWMVAAPDAHPIDGSFSFTVTALAPASGAEPSAQDSATEEPAPVDNAALSSAEETVDLETFLETGDTKPAGADAMAAAARILGVIGAVLVIGGAAFAFFGLRGDPGDVRNVLYWVRRGGVLLVIGAIGRAATTTVTLAGDWSSLTSLTDLSNALWSSTGLAIALRAVGGLFAASRTGLETTTASASGDPVVVARRLATVGAGHNVPVPADRAPDEPFVYAEDHVWDHRFAIGGLVGVCLVAVSFMFDGHTASEGPRWLDAVANLAHVTTAAVWAGGVAMLVLTMQRRRSDNRPIQALQLAMRFSVIATVALVAAGLAGFALAVIVLDSISEIWSTPWGRLLMLKVALVAAAAAGGAYNHRIVVPALDQHPDDQPTVDRFRSVVTFEALALIAVIIATAFLIGASST